MPVTGADRRAKRDRRAPREVNLLTGHYPEDDALLERVHREELERQRAQQEVNAAYWRYYYEERYKPPTGFVPIRGDIGVDADEVRGWPRG